MATMNNILQSARVYLKNSGAKLTEDQNKTINDWIKNNKDCPKNGEEVLKALFSSDEDRPGFSPFFIGWFNFEVAQLSGNSKKRNADEDEASHSAKVAKKEVEDGRLCLDLSKEYKVRGEYCDSPVGLLLEQLDKIMYPDSEFAHPSQARAPFILMLQSSGYGKTRAVVELAKQRRIVYLLCKRLETEGSWPVPQALQELLHKYDTVEDAKDASFWQQKWKKFLTAVVRTAEEYETPQKLFGAQVINDEKVGPFYTKLSNVYRETPPLSPPLLKNPLQNGPSATLSTSGATSPQSQAVTPLRNAPQVTPVNQQQANPSSLQATASTPTPGATTVSPSIAATTPAPKNVSLVVDENDLYKHSKVVNENSLIVCLDEASALTKEAIRGFRRAAKMLGIVTVFVDTAPSIHKIVPTNDSSEGAGVGALGPFLPPLNVMNTSDLSWKASKRDDDWVNLFCAGRPRWESVYQQTCGNEAQKLQKLIEVAQTLLTRAKNGSNEQGKDFVKLEAPKDESEAAPDCINMISPGMVAVFACRFSLGPRSKMAWMLAKHSLATVAHVTKNREVVSTFYPSEPVLAEASARYTRDPRNMDVVLASVKAALQQNELDPPRGDVGEMCAAALLGLTMDSLRSPGLDPSNPDINYSGPVSLKALLQQFKNLELESAEDKEAIDAALDGWFVNFTHFCRPHGNNFVRDDPVLNQNDLHIMWMRRMAYYAPPGMKGLDKLCAIKHATKGYGTLRVQTKNFADKLTTSFVKKVFTKLWPTKCPPKVKDEEFSVGLMLSVNEVEELLYLQEYETKKKIIPQVRRPSASKSSDSSGIDKTDAGSSGGNDAPPKKLVLQLAAPFPRNLPYEDKLWEMCQKKFTVEMWDANALQTNEENWAELEKQGTAAKDDGKDSDSGTTEET